VCVCECIYTDTQHIYTYILRKEGERHLSGNALDILQESILKCFRDFTLYSLCIFRFSFPFPRSTSFFLFETNQINLRL